MSELKRVRARCPSGRHMSPAGISQHSLWVWLDTHECDPGPDRAAGTGSLVLVWRDERGEEITRTVPLTPGTKRIGIPLDAQHVDLLDGA